MSLSAICLGICHPKPVVEPATPGVQGKCLNGLKGRNRTIVNGENRCSGYLVNGRLTLSPGPTK